MWVAIHKCMEARLEFSLYSYLYLSVQLAKTLCLFYYLLCFLFNKIGVQEGGTGSAWKKKGAWRGQRLPKQCIHMCIMINKRKTEINPGNFKTQKNV
jgi:hypothetical protein